MNCDSEINDGELSKLYAHSSIEWLNFHNSMHLFLGAVNKFLEGIFPQKPILFLENEFTIYWNF